MYNQIIFDRPAFLYIVLLQGRFSYWTEVLVDISWNQGSTRIQMRIRKGFGLIVAVKDNDCFLSL